MNKPPVPTDHISKNHWDDVFFGDSKVQEQIADTIVKDLMQKQGGIYLILGPTRTGKTSVFDIVAEKIGKNIPNPNIIDHYQDQPLLIDRSGLKHNIVQQEVDIEIIDLADSVKKAREILKNCSNTSIILDGLLHKPRLPGKAENRDEILRKEDDKKLKEFLIKNPDIMVVQTKYNIEQIKYILWDLNQDLVQKYSETGTAIHEELLERIQGADINKIVTALNENNKSKYELAFQRIIEQQIDLPD